MSYISLFFCYTYLNLMKPPLNFALTKVLLVIVKYEILTVNK